jgi:hypothetical protein
MTPTQIRRLAAPTFPSSNIILYNDTVYTGERNSTNTWNDSLVAKRF